MRVGAPRPSEVRRHLWSSRFSCGGGFGALPPPQGMSLGSQPLPSDGTGRQRLPSGQLGARRARPGMGGTGGAQLHLRGRRRPGAGPPAGGGEPGPALPPRWARCLGTLQHGLLLLLLPARGTGRHRPGERAALAPAPLPLGGVRAGPRDRRLLLLFLLRSLLRAAPGQSGSSAPGAASGDTDGGSGLRLRGGGGSRCPRPLTVAGSGAPGRLCPRVRRLEAGALSRLSPPPPGLRAGGSPRIYVFWDKTGKSVF